MVGLFVHHHNSLVHHCTLCILDVCRWSLFINLNVLVYIRSVCRLLIELKPKIFKKNLEKSQTQKDQKQERLGF